MKSITIHGIDEDLDRLIREKAVVYGTSLNGTIKKLLRDYLGLGTKKIDRKNDFKEFLGVWSKKEGKEFEKRIADSEKIDREDWE